MLPGTNATSEVEVLSEPIKPPVIARWYKDIQCPYCNTVCYPDAITRDGIVIYNKHTCRQMWAQHSPIERRLEADKKGNLII